MEPCTLSALVNARDRQIRFTCLVHHTTKEQDRLIEEDFYYNHGGTVPRGDHHEMEVIEPRTKPLGTHIHVNPNTGRQFVCWACPLRTYAEAQAVFVIWCLGTAYTILEGKDFVPLLAGSNQEFQDMMNEDYGIFISVLNT